MASSDRVEQVTAVASPPQIRVVGFCAKNRPDASHDTMSTSAHSVAESPLSQMLRSATWPCLRVRPGKSEISRPLALARRTDCSTSPKFMHHARSLSQNSDSSSPISIPGAGSWMRDADLEGDAPDAASAGALAHLVCGVVQISDSPKACQAVGHKEPEHEGGNFAEACWILE